MLVVGTGTRAPNSGSTPTTSCRDGLGTDAALECTRTPACPRGPRPRPWTEPHRQGGFAMKIDVQPNAGRKETAGFLASEIQARRLHDFLRRRREHLKLSQEDVAHRLDISGRAYGDWERGRVKEWKDGKLYALAEALEMTEYQTTLLFLYAVGRAPQPDLRAAPHRPESEDHAVAAFLGDYTVMMDALSLPSFVIDQAWDVKMANKAFRDLCSSVRAHPTAMPTRNFLRFGLFHPDASAILIDHLKWQLAMLAQLSSNLE